MRHNFSVEVLLFNNGDVLCQGVCVVEGFDCFAWSKCVCKSIYVRIYV